MTNFLVVGEALVDVIGGIEHVGGSPANVALGLGRLGNDVTLLTQIGADEHGVLIQKHLATSGVSVIGSSEASTSTATATIAADGSATYEFDLTWDVDISLAPDADLVHVGSIGATVAPGADEVRLLVTVRRPSSLISFDPNIRPALVGPREAAVRRVEHLVALSDIVKVSAEDLGWLYSSANPEASAERWARIGGPLVVMTDGGGPVIALWHGRRLEIAPLPVRVVDTVGAGDAFMAGLLDALGHAVPGLDRDEFSALDEQAIFGALRSAMTCAAITVSRAGADLPGLGELEKFKG